MDQVGEAALRLMAGVVPRKTMTALRGEIVASPERYPWREVTDQILADPVEDGRLVQQGLRAQRDWVLRGGRETPRKPVATRGKFALAFVLSRLIFFAIYTVAVVVLLILLKRQWPAFDIYRILEWLRELLPGLFGSR